MPERPADREGAENKPALVVEVAPTTKTGERAVVCREGTARNGRPGTPAADSC